MPEIRLSRATMHNVTRSSLSSRPWLALKDGDLGHACRVPSMLNREETQFYFWLADRMAHVPGQVVDLGCFVGGSTAYLAAGSRARRHGRYPQITAYDQFRASPKVKERQLYAKGIAPFNGDDILPLSNVLLAPWSEDVVLRKGRIEETAWRGGPISLLILDASKTSHTMDRMAEIFFPHLIPGVSVIVQQDELHWKEPWIAAHMEQLKICFQPLCYVPGGAMAYLCVRRLDPDMLRAKRVHGLDDDALISALSKSRLRLRAFGVAHKIERQIDAVRRNPGQRKSWRFKNRAPMRQVQPHKIAAE